MQGEEALFPDQIGEGGVHQRAGELPGPVGPEVHEDDRVAGADDGLPAAEHGDHKLIGDARVIRALYGLNRVGLKGSLPQHQGVIGLLHPVPALIPVHGVVPAGNHADFGAAQRLAFVLQPGDEVPAGGGGTSRPSRKAWT